jgi:hypothetical protein
MPFGTSEFIHAFEVARYIHLNIEAECERNLTITELGRLARDMASPFYFRYQVERFLRKDHNNKMLKDAIPFLNTMCEREIYKLINKESYVNVCILSSNPNIMINCNSHNNDYGLITANYVYKFILNEYKQSLNIDKMKELIYNMFDSLYLCNIIKILLEKDPNNNILIEILILLKNLK